MQFNDLLFQYFGSRSLDDIEDGSLIAGIAKIQVDLGLSRDPGQRFALWSMLYMLGAAPDLEVAFPEASEREAARTFMDLMASAEDGPET